MEALKTGWVSNVLFEPKVGNEILKSIAQNEKNLKILYSTSTQSVSKLDGNNFNYQIKTSEGTFISKILIDGTELGDLLQMLDDDYDVGMDSNEMYDENIAPEIKNDIIQDLTFVMILKNYNKKVKIDKPEGYDASEFYCSTSHKDCPESDKALWSPQQMMNYGKLPNDKIMINWPIYGNDYYSCLLYTSPSPRDGLLSRMPSSA